MELKRLTLKALVADRSQPLEYRGYYNHLLVKLPKKLSISFFRNYCHRTGSGRSVFRTFKYSRHEVKRLSNKGLVSGFRKSSF
jgi:small subunit ribosomal protein S14